VEPIQQKASAPGGRVITQTAFTNVNVSLYSTLSHSASNVLNVPNTAETSVPSIGDQNWWCWVLDHARH